MAPKHFGSSSDRLMPRTPSRCRCMRWATTITTGTNVRWARSEEEEEEEMEEVDTVNLHRQNDFPSHLQTQRGRYLTLGRKYYKQAAELNSPEGATVNSSHSFGCPLSCPSSHRPLQLGDNAA